MLSQSLPSTILTTKGDTFDILALDFYNEESYSHYIIAANPDYCDVVVFEDGIELYIPEIDEYQNKESLPPWRR